MPLCDLLPLPPPEGEVWGEGGPMQNPLTPLMGEGEKGQGRAR
jgi:hypothetical protein